MRPAGQRYKADYKIKQEMLNNIGMEVHVAVDDRQQVVEMWRKNGVVEVYHVRRCKYIKVASRA